MTFLDDLVNNNGRPRQVDTSGFEVGRNLAATPGKVVFRNELMELIQYAPQTEQVHARPLLCSPPWINKYYVMDLAPGRSFIEWAVQHGRTVFAISYLNPSKDMGGTTMDDYLVNGPQTALDVVQEITGAETIDIVGLCLGGALTAITAAYLTQGNDSRVGTLTLLNTMLDYTEPGVLGNFTDERTVEKLIKKIAKSGTLEGTSMAGTFDILRANDLIFNYVVSNWLMGQDPPSFDILAWNGDSTRMPAAMHAFYLRNFYVRNKLAAGTLEIAGPHHRPERDQVADLRRQRDQRPHRAVAVGVQDHGAGQRPGAVRAQQRRPHRGHRQPAEPEGVVPRPRRGLARRGRRRRGGRPRSARPARGGRTGPAGRASPRATWSTRRSWAAPGTRCWATRRGATSTPDRSAACSGAVSRLRSTAGRGRCDPLAAGQGGVIPRYVCPGLHDRRFRALRVVDPAVCTLRRGSPGLRRP